MEKFYFMGHYYQVQDVRDQVLSVTKLEASQVASEADLNEAIEWIIRGDPTLYSRFAQAMHALRTKPKKS